MSLELIYWGYGATAARLTPDQKVGSSNLSGLICHTLAAMESTTARAPQHILTGVWRNGSASDSRSEGWEFESLCPQFLAMGIASRRVAKQLRGRELNPGLLRDRQKY